jgi:acetylornithine deacetylase/succinyl-diaminopimelate desuccinylase-like protein
LASDDSILATQAVVTGIPAPTGDEATRGAWVARRFKSLGLEGVHVDDAGNVIGRRSGVTAAPGIAICAHLDTVFPRDAVTAVVRDGDRLIAPGIGDNGRGLATMLALAEAIDGFAVRTLRPVTFVATTGEEGAGDLKGAKFFFQSHPQWFAAIAVDGTGDDLIVHRAVGSKRFRVTLSGPGGHSWSDYGTVNPLHAASQAMAKLSALILPSEPRTALTIARVGGGLSINSIPGAAWFEVDVRSTSPEPLRRLEIALRGIVETAVLEANAQRARRTMGLESRIDVIGDRPCGELPPDHPLVMAAMTATRLIGRAPELATASTDANVPLSLGIPAIAIGGGGRGGDVHTLGEWYENDEGPRGIARALTVAVAAAGMDA